MKKSLLLLSFAAIASVASAQVVAGLATVEQLETAGLSGTKVDMEAKTILDDEAASFGLAYQDSWGTTSAYKNYQNVKVDGTEITLGDGAVGNTNPTFIAYEEGVMSAGAVFVFKAKKNGWMTVFTKMNPNKQYLVFEGKKGALAFTLGYANGKDMFSFTMPHNDDYEIVYDTADASKYFVVGTKQSKNTEGVLLWENKTTGEIVAKASNPTVKGDDAQQYKAVMEDVPGTHKPAMPWSVAGYPSKIETESTGFLTFNVVADTEYYFSALGSKCACQGFVFTESETQPTIVYAGTDELPEVTFAPGKEPVAGVDAVVATDNADAPIYNMMGVRVNADAKGILIQNGKKFIRK